MGFTVNGGNVTDIFITEAEFLDRFVGNQLWGMGSGSGGLVGNNSIISRSSPTQTVSATTNWVSISAQQTPVAIKTDGTLWTWGLGSGGTMGTNAVVNNRSSPVQTVSATTNWRSAANGFASTIATKTDGTLWVWGCGCAGEMGNNSTINRSSPVQTVSATTNWRQVSSGFYQVAAIKTDGTLWLWGKGTYGKIGNNSTINQSSPVQTVSATTNWKQVSTNLLVTGAIKTDGTLWMWGYAGLLGDGVGTVRHSSPIQTISGGTNWRQISIGRTHVSAIKTDGTLWNWGTFSGGALGNNGDGSGILSPIQTVAGGTNWKCVSAGYQATAATKTDGTLWVWGCGNAGQFGNNSTISRSSPVQTVAGGTTWKSPSTGIANIFAITFNS